jgi:hypothetical protein
MKRLVFAGIIFLFLLAVAALAWFGQYFLSYAIPPEELSVDEFETQLQPIGKPLTLDLHGTGFNSETSVSLVMDIGNQDAVVGSLPLGGVYNESLVVDEYLYLARDSGGLELLNIEMPQRPRLLKAYLSGKTIVDINRHGHYLFLSCGRLGVTIMQILPGGLLKYVTDIVPGYTVWSSRCNDSFLFIATRSGGVQVYDIHEPQNSRLVATLEEGANVHSLALFDNYIYFPVTTGVDIYRIDNPQHPFLVGSLVMTEDLQDLTIQNQQLYLATEKGVHLYSLEDRSHPRFLKHWPVYGSADKIFPGKDHIYVSDSFSGLRIIGSSVDSSEELINLSVNPRTVAETEDFLFVAGSNRGLLILDRKIISPRQVVETIDTTGSVHDLFVRDHWIFVANAQGGVSLHDLEDSGATFPLVTNRRSESFAALQNHLYIAQGNLGIEVVDISEIDRPVSLQIWPNLPAVHMAAVGHYLVVSNGTNGLKLIDISDISQPVVKASLAGIHPLDITVDGSLIFVASKSKGLLIYKINDDCKFDLVGELRTPFPMNEFDMAMGVQVKKGIAYIANGRSGMLTVDIDDPRRPVILSSVGIPGVSKAISVEDHQAFVVSHQTGINIFDVSDPKKPVLKNKIEVLGLSRGIQVVDNLIYIAHRAVGVTVIPVPVDADVKKISKHRMGVSFSSPRFPGRYSLQISNGRKLVVHDGAITYQ